MDGREGSGALDLESALSALPVFPLPGTVFFPNTLLPLHVFEPRYRQMTENVLVAGGMMGVVLLQDGSGALHSVAGLGRVIHHERLPDGRFHILLQGMARVRLVEELPADGLLYRRVRARLLTDVEEDAADVARELKTLKACYSRFLEACPEARAGLGDLCARIHDPAMLADIICASVLEEPCTRQAALEDLSVVGRLKRASDALAAALLVKMGDDGCIH